jgi:hypothetical protein
LLKDVSTRTVFKDGFTPKQDLRRYSTAISSSLLQSCKGFLLLPFKII